MTITAVALVLWCGLVVWLAVEHGRVREKARAALLQRARDISDTIALLSRTGRGGVIREDRLNRALEELVEWELLDAIVLLNAHGETVASAGRADLVDASKLQLGAVRWGTDAAFVMNLVDLGGQTEAAPRNPTIVMPAPPPPNRDDRATTPTGVIEVAPPPPRPSADAPTTPPRRGGRWQGGRPPWMSEAEFKQLLEKRGFHSFVLMLNTGPMAADLAADLKLRIGVAAAALLGVLALLYAVAQWSRSNALLLKLVQSQQQNDHLKELNLAAAGLAHETRNPLNVVRGLAQTIEHDQRTDATTRDRVRQIMEEIDMVTVRLNEFIRYSKPPEPVLVPVTITSVAENVRAALQCDIEGRAVRIEVMPDARQFLADEMLLRQLLFNLMLNAVQSVREPGVIEVRVEADAEGVMLCVDDNGPGVPEDLRQEVFRPYFTTTDRGSGLGLAVVRQICLAHDWLVECSTSPLGGARFAVKGIIPARGGNQ